MIDVDVEEFKNIWLEHTNNETADYFGVSRSTVDRIAKRHGLFKRRVDLPNVFTQKQHNLLIGSLLGDGSLSKPRKVKSNFAEWHSVVQKDYLSWKNDLLKPFSRKLIPRPPTEVVFPNGKIGQRKESWQCYTLYHSVFYEMEKEWYLRNNDGDYILKGGRRVKCLPSKLNITPFVLAVWFFDDGRNFSPHRQAFFSTDGFSDEECERLVDLIELGVGIKTKLRLVKKDKVEINVPAKSYFDFMDLIRDQKIPCECMDYKIDISKSAFARQFSQEKLNSVFDLREKGWTYKEIAIELGTSFQYVCKIYNHQKHRRKNAK